jgi:hypothetical protein
VRSRLSHALGCEATRVDPKEEEEMASRLDPYITFPGTAREAMEFYKGVFGGDLTLSTFTELGGQDAPNPDQIMHSQLETERGLLGAGHARDRDRGSDATSRRTRPRSPRPRPALSAVLRATGYCGSL